MVIRIKNTKISNTNKIEYVNIIYTITIVPENNMMVTQTINNNPIFDY